MIEQLERSLGAPVRLELLKQSPGRRSTYRAHGSRRTAIVKVYEANGAQAVARRVGSLGEGPFEPRVPQVLAEMDDMVVLTEIRGRPLRAAVLAGDGAACHRAGTVLGLWHWHWRDRAPEALPRHTLERELEALRRQAEGAPSPIAEAVAFALKAVEDDEEWPPATVVHRDLSEEQVLLGDEVGLIDLDDAAIGPPELDVGNLCANLEFLARRYGRNLDPMQHALLNGYLSSGAPLGLPLLLTCRSLSLLRLACIHKDAQLASTHAGAAWPPPPDVASAG
ncbi:MAG TPA: aminoglycoside phosphotransferase family protein [Gaiellaceae bacterium]